MRPHQRRFLELALALDVLRFGEFRLKSGRISPYFFNAGRFDSGLALSGLGEAYASAALADAPPFDMLFGPAYKGIPLAVATAIALAREHGRDVPVAYNRKEAKHHGEAGVLIGAPLAGQVLIIDDVITAGTSVRESIALIRAAGATPCGVLIALDRCERGSGDRSAADEVRAEFGIPVVAIATIVELLALTEVRADLVQHRDRLVDYRSRYGVVQPSATTN